MFQNSNLILINQIIVHCNYPVIPHELSVIICMQTVFIRKVILFLLISLVIISCLKSVAALFDFVYSFMLFVVPQSFTIDSCRWGWDSFEIRQFQDHFPTLSFYRLCLFSACFGSTHIYLHTSGIAGSFFVEELSTIAAGNTHASSLESDIDSYVELPLNQVEPLQWYSF